MFRKLLTFSLLSLMAFMGFFGSVRFENRQHANISRGIKISLVVEGISVVDAADVNAGGAGGAGGGNTPATDTTKSPKDTEIQKAYNAFVVLLNSATDILTIFVAPAIMFAGWLMSPDWTTGDFFGIRGVLHELWIMVSNLTYFIYAILLIFVALATIFNSANYGYKQLLHRIIIGIILVPLSWWFVQFVISLSTIVTASVINIPTETIQSYMEGRSTGDNWYRKDTIPMNYSFYIQSSGKDSGSLTSCKTDRSQCTSPEKILKSSGGMYSSLLIYGNSIFKLSEIKELNGIFNTLKSIAQLGNQLFISLIMFLIFGLLVIALVFMLMMRAIKLWFYAIFSPLMTLKYTIGKNDGFFGGKENSENFDLKEFLGLAFVPALVGLALSFGLMIITVLYSANGNNTTSGANSTSTPCTVARLKDTSSGCLIANIMGSPENEIRAFALPDKDAQGNEIPNQFINVTKVKMGLMTLSFYGSTVSSISENDVTDTIQILSAAGGVFGMMIIDMIALAFIWMAFMAAKSVTKVARIAVEPFEQAGKKIGGFVKNLPRYAPIPFTGMTAGGIERLAEMPTHIAQAKESEKMQPMIDRIQKAAGIKDAFSDTTKKNLEITSGLSPDLMAANYEALKKYKTGVENIVRGGIDPDDPDGKKLTKHVADVMRKNKNMLTQAGLFTQAEIQSIDNTSEKVILARLLGAKNIQNSDDHVAKDFIKNFKSKESTVNNSSAAAQIPPVTVGKSDFKIGDITINTSIDSNPEKIAEAIVGKTELKGKYSKDQIKSLMEQADAFRGSDNAGKLTKLLEALEKQGYFNPLKEEAKK